MFKNMVSVIYIYSRNSLTLWGSGDFGATFRAPSARPLGRRRRPFPAAFGGGKTKTNKKFGAPQTPLLGGTCGAHSFKNFRRVMRIPNMCLVLKLDNGKVVSIVNGQTESQTHRTIQYRISIQMQKHKTEAVQKISLSCGSLKIVERITGLFAHEKKLKKT